jgi:hypothetical protein
LTWLNYCFNGSFLLTRKSFSSMNTSLQNPLAGNRAKTDSRLPPKARICLPPVLKRDFEAIALECPHPAWAKLERRGRHFVITTNDLEDLEEIADWARAALVEPPRALLKGERQGYQAVIGRVAAWAVLEPLGACHLMASAWRHERQAQSRMVTGKGKIIEA